MNLPMFGILVAAFLACLSECGCTSEPTCEMRPVCLSPEDRAAAADFVIKCATAANPLSDEEGEDLVRQCQWTATDLLCQSAMHCLAPGPRWVLKEAKP